MRYIPERASDFITQVPEDRNSYINILNIGASGKGDIQFTGTITDIQDNIVTISNISDGQDGNLSQYRDVLRSGVEIETFSYSFAGNVQSPSIQSNPPTVTGVDFSSSTGINPNLAPLTYFVYGYDQSTGKLPNSKLTINIGTKVLNPSLWNIDQYVQLNFTRTGDYVLPVIFRLWGNQLRFLGVIGNNKVGYPGTGSTSFRDLGLTEIPSWNPESELPVFMSDVFSVSGLNVTQLRTISTKSRLTIQPPPLGTSPEFIQARGFVLDMSLGETVKFYIDDTQFVQSAINTAANGRIKEVFFPAGTYNLRDTFFTNAEGVSLRGTGDTSVIRRTFSTLSNTSQSGLIYMSGEGIRVRDITFDGNKFNTFSSAPPIESEVALSINNSSRVVISGVSVINSGGGGISINNSEGITFTENKISFTGRPYEQSVSPVTIFNSSNVIAQGNIFEYSTTSPKVISTEFSTINGNIIRSCGDKGLDLQTSFQWNAQGNLAYSDNDSIIRSIDTYNNEYSRATIEVRKGFSLDPVYMTVTYAGESVSILKDSVQAEIFSLDSTGAKSTKIGSFRVIETSAQLDVGIFSLTLPGSDSVTIGGETVPATIDLNDPDGYVYEVRASVLIGNGTRGYQPLSIRRTTINSTEYLAINFRNPSDILSLQIYSEGSLENDSISIRDFSNSNLTGWDQSFGYPVVGIDTDTNSILIDPIPGLSLTSTPIEFLGGNLFILRSNYYVADGNLYVQSF